MTHLSDHKIKLKKKVYGSCTGNPETELVPSRVSRNSSTQPAWLHWLQFDSFPGFQQAEFSGVASV